MNFWRRSERDVWTSWFYNFMVATARETGEELYSLSYCLDECSKGYAVNHQVGSQPRVIIIVILMTALMTIAVNPQVETS